ncbi:NADH-quinone oxidoreductase subunit I [Saccharothrix sp. ALI-22-I]|uniref:NADH-quinone oxidoreductase subunit A n=1 Tax=Saccharothrix sp. ALI-22-I TaxID=1933778 RepID=UPI00097C912D|nr:NADH-quinone oxidoreductase subunit A [Saccharothrix sp. ALI-22-I]ONI90931.1 NADH-quinone oxidoreductase subunit I [Saccharothrix sp. ALI-22-I]
MTGVVTLLVVTTALVAALYGVAMLVRVGAALTDASPFLSGHAPQEHAVSRYHVRWYTITMVFLAFDMEMVFMYPWTLVVARMGTTAVVEMFLFLAVLMAGVWYAWREGVFRWT